MNFHRLIFQQDIAPAHKSMVMGIFARRRVEGTRMAGIQSRSESFWNFWEILKQRLQKLAVFWEKFRKFVRNLNEVNAVAVQSLYERLKNRLQDVKKVL